MNAPNPIRVRTPRGQGRSRVVKAASELFAEQGVSGTSLQAIADRLGVTKAAVYHQFPSKGEIVTAVAEPAIHRLNEIADGARGLEAYEAGRWVIRGLVDLALAESGTAAILRRDPAMSAILAGHEGYRQAIGRIDTLLLGDTPTALRRATLAFVGGGLANLSASAERPTTAAEREAIVAAAARALDLRHPS